MKSIIYLSIIIFALIGCGGGSGENGFVKIESNAVVAYKVENSAWQTLKKNQNNNYKIKANGKYKVALKCSKDEVYVLALNTKEDKEVIFYCPFDVSFGTVDVSGNLQDSVDGLNNFAVAIDIGNYGFFNNNYNLPKVATGTKDILSITIAGVTPKRFLALRDKPIGSSHKTYNINFTTSNSYEIKSKSFIDISPTKSDRVLITKHKTYFTSSLSKKWYYSVGGLIDSDYFITASKISSKNTYRIDCTKATKIEKKDVSNDISYINSLNSITYNSGVLNGLSYNSSSKSLPFKGYIIDLDNTSLKKQYHILISKSYLDEDDSYIIDDLTSLPDFSTVCNGNLANSVNASAIMVDKKLGNIFKDVDFFKKKGFEMLPYIKNSTIELATERVK